MMLVFRSTFPFAVLLALGACSSDQSAAFPASPASSPTPEEAAVQGAAAPEGATPAAADDVPDDRAGGEGARVVETMNSGGYTYALLDDHGKKTWYAVAECSLSVGDRVIPPANAFPQRGFESKTLGRTFDEIWFAQGFERVGGAVGAAVSDAGEKAHGAAKAEGGEKVAEAPAVAKADGGMTVAEIWALGKEGAGKEVVLRGKVVKYNGGILGANWLHVRDGTGAEGKDDITVTTQAEANVGDTVLVKGKLSADRDFGAGYFYELILENADVTVEK